MEKITSTLVGVEGLINNDPLPVGHPGHEAYLRIVAIPRAETALKKAEAQTQANNIARAKFSPDCCDESKQDLRDWIECGFKFCPWCGRELRPIA